jgi:hypothetical protein
LLQENGTNDSQNDDDIPVVEPEILPRGAQQERRRKPRKQTAWLPAILSRVFCLFLWVIMAWIAMLCVLAFGVGLLISLFNPNVRARRPAMLLAFQSNLLASLTLMFGGFIGMFSPRLALALVAAFFARMGDQASFKRYRDLWSQGMHRFWRGDRT